MRYRSKPQEVEAVQWKGYVDDDVKQFISPAESAVGKALMRAGSTEECGHRGRMHPLAGKDGAQGWVPVPAGHWLVRNPSDLTGHWPVDPDYFASKYEIALDAEDGDDA